MLKKDIGYLLTTQENLGESGLEKDPNKLITSKNRT